MAGEYEISEMDIPDPYFSHLSNSSGAQKSCISEIVEGKNDTIITMPDGYGKSFCYQFPAAIQTSKVTIVFCQNTSGIKEKIQYLYKLGIEASCLSTESVEMELQYIYDNLFSSNINIRLLYVTIEDAQTDYFKEIFEHITKTNKLAYVVVENAHYVSSISLMYDVEYLKIRQFRILAHRIPWIMVTYTDNFKVLDDIALTFLLKSPISVIKIPCFRVNTHYDIVFEEESVMKYDHLIEYLQQWLNLDEQLRVDNQYSCGVIYCKTTIVAQEISKFLNGARIKATYFSEDLTRDGELDALENFGTKKLRIIVTTVEYCKVFSQTNISLAIHWNIPFSQSNYYETTGIAGLNLRPAKCRVYNLLAPNTEPDNIIQKAINIANKCKDKRKFEIIYCMYLRWKRFYHDKQNESYTNILKTFKRKLKKCHTCTEELNWDEFISYIEIESNETQINQSPVESEQFEVQDNISMEVRIGEFSNDDIFDDDGVPLVQGNSQTSSNSMEIV